MIVPARIIITAKTINFSIEEFDMNFSAINLAI